MSDPARDRGEWAPFVWLNGTILPSAQARISVFDRGLLLGDGVYETVRELLMCFPTAVASSSSWLVTA